MTVGITPRAFACLLASLLFVLPASANAGASAIEGTWKTPDKSEITIKSCNQGFCGYISKVVVPPDVYAVNKAAVDELSGHFTDQMNKDPSLRDRPILGLKLLTVHRTDTPGYFEGKVYNPQDGGTYKGKLKVVGSDKLRLDGCFLVFCKGQEWTRAN